MPTAVTEKSTLSKLNQQLIEKAKKSRKTRERKHFGEAKLLTIQKCREKEAKKEKKEAIKLSNRERRAALKGKVKFTKEVFWRELKMDIDLFE